MDDLYSCILFFLSIRNLGGTPLEGTIPDAIGDLQYLNHLLFTT